MSATRSPDPDNPALALIGLGIIDALIGAGAGILYYLPLGLVMAVVGGIAGALIGFACGLLLGIIFRSF